MCSSCHGVILNLALGPRAGAGRNKVRGGLCWGRAQCPIAMSEAATQAAQTSHSGRATKCTSLSDIALQPDQGVTVGERGQARFRLYLAKDQENITKRILHSGQW